MSSLWKFLINDNWFFVSPLDWLIIVLPIAFVLYMGWRSRRYVAQVSDFLTAGRLGGRYILGVADIANGLSIISLVAYVEVHYRTGFALTFWQNLTMPLGIILSMTGFVTYRYRATKAMSFGQFIEMRYSRGLRIFSSALRSTSEVLANMIMPAIAGRFFIYFLGLPQRFMLWGIEFDTFNVLILFCLSLALAIIFMGGRLSLMITDCIQGMFCYPIMAIFVGFILYKFSWNDQIVPVLTDRVANQSFLDPYDISDLRDFNLFYVGVTLLTVFLNRGNWLGSGSQSCAKSPHEAKMASLLGSYRSSLASVLYILVAVALIVYFNHKDFAQQAREVRNSISSKIADDIFTDPVHKNLKGKVLAAAEQQPQIIHNVGVDKPLSEDENLDTRYLANIKNIITTNPDSSAEENASMYQQFRTLYDQMRTAVGVRHMLPPGLSGLFCLLMLMAMISTDDTRMFSSATTIFQDVILPFLKKPLTPVQHMWMLRGVSALVAVCFYVGSTLMSQLDYINLFVATMVTMWIGAGSMVMFGLYSSFGTTAGAWASVGTGCVFSLVYIGLKQYWTNFYAFLVDMGWLNSFTKVVEGIARPFEPIIVWRVNPYKCFMNAYEFKLLVTVLCLVIYIVVSKLTCKEPFNLDRMLHRGKYNLDNLDQKEFAWTWKNILNKLITITPQYTFWDRVQAYSIFVYSLIYRFLFTFVFIVIWNIFDRWPKEWWSTYFLVTGLLVPGAIAVIVTFWFGWGSVVDMRQLFHDLKNRKLNFLDNGMVEGNMSLADKAELEAIDAVEKEKVQEKTQAKTE